MEYGTGGSRSDVLLSDGSAHVRGMSKIPPLTKVQDPNHLNLIEDVLCGRVTARAPLELGYDHH